MGDWGDCTHILLLRRWHNNSTWNWFHVFNYERLFSFCYWWGILSTRYSFKLFRQYHHGEGMHQQRYHKAIFQRGWHCSMAEESETCGETSAGGWCGESATIIFGGWHTGLYMEMEEDDQKQREQIKAQLKEAFTDDVFTAYRKVIMIRWAGDHVDIYANKIRQLIGLAGFKGDGL